jgi:thiol-disulfide isomerase/thioredoxin
MKIEFSSSTTSTPAAVDNPLFQSLDLSHLKDLLPKHRFTLVNMWASWCGPCKAEFPELIELKKRHADQGLDVVFMSVDRPADRGDANAFLMEQKIDFLTYFAAEPIDNTIQAIAGEWAGAIPASFLYNATGERVDSWQGAGNIDDFEAKILPLLAK